MHLPGNLEAGRYQTVYADEQLIESDASIPGLLCLAALASLAAELTAVCRRGELLPFWPETFLLPASQFSIRDHTAGLPSQNRPKERGSDPPLQTLPARHPECVLGSTRGREGSLGGGSLE